LNLSHFTPSVGGRKDLHRLPPTGRMDGCVVAKMLENTGDNGGGASSLEAGLEAIHTLPPEPLGMYTPYCTVPRTIRELLDLSPQNCWQLPTMLLLQRQ
jgi:hypothetical protein